MPWKIEKRSGSEPYCVIQKISGENEGCHATRNEAKRHMAALYASEGKEADMDKATWSAATKNNLPDSAFLYVETGDKDAEGKTIPRSNRHLPYKEASGNVDLPHLRNAISRLEQPKTGTGTDGWLTESLRERLLSKARGVLRGHQKSVLDHLSDGLKWLFGLDKEEPDERVNRFMVWKDQGRWRWLAIYSNKFRDDDSPPEILAEKAHRDFVAAVDAGEWDYPEMWLWHVPGTKSGYADFVAYDDRGFSIASGIVENKRVAKALAEDDDLLVSHGMPTEEIRRDEADSTIITRYRTREISPLPSRVAANKLTGFTTIGGTMAIPKEKREDLLKWMGEEDFATLEATLADKSKQAEGLEFKDVPTEEEVASPDTEVKDEVVTEPEDESMDEQPVYVTQADLVEHVGGLFAEVNATLQSLTEVIQGFDKELKELKRSEDERLAERIGLIPAASLGDQLRQRAIGADEAKADGRKAEGKAGPKETPSLAKGRTPIGFINDLVEASRQTMQ